MEKPTQEGTQMNAEKLRLYRNVIGHLAKLLVGENAQVRIDAAQVFAPAVVGVHCTNGSYVLVYSTKTRGVDAAEATKRQLSAVMPEAWKAFSQGYIPVKPVTDKASFALLRDQVAKCLFQPLNGKPIEWFPEPLVIACEFLYATQARPPVDPNALTLVVGQPDATNIDGVGGVSFANLDRIALPPLQQGAANAEAPPQG